jgi:transposase
MNFRKKITKEQLEILIELISTENDDAKAVRRSQSIILLEDKASDATIKMMTGYKREVAVKLRNKYLRLGIKALQTKKKTKKLKELLTRSQREAIVTILNTQKPSDFGYENQEIWTTKILADLIEEQWGVRYKSRTSLYLLFKKAEFTFRKPESQSERRNEQAIADWKEKFKPIIEEECARKDSVVLVGDEAALSSETRLQRAWLPLGGPAIVQNTAKRKMVHLYGFLEIGPGVAHAFKTIAQTGEITISVLKKLAKYYGEKRIVLFWDNASWHKSDEVKRFLDTTKQFQLYNFPPYAPDLNPQEHVWKELREKKLNNKLIKDINAAAKDAISFIENSIFKYKFFGAHGTFSM